LEKKNPTKKPGGLTGRPRTHKKRLKEWKKSKVWSKKGKKAEKEGVRGKEKGK